MKRFLAILCVCALVLSLAACKKEKPNTPDAETDKKTTEINKEDKENKETDEDNTSSIVPDETGYENIEGEDPADTTVTLTEGGTEEGLWPAEDLPESIPSYTDYSEMYAATYENYDNSEEWYLGFETTENDYNDWVTKLEKQGYRKSEKIFGFWANGDHILDLLTEDVDGEFCVSVDIIKSDPVEFPAAVSNVFPIDIKTDATLYGWYIVDNEDGSKTLSVSYVCGSDFATDLETYKSSLTSKGFTVTDEKATIDVDGKTFFCEYGETLDRYEDRIDFTYFE